jgi:hypothetical protein
MKLRCAECSGPLTWCVFLLVQLAFFLVHEGYLSFGYLCAAFAAGVALRLGVMFWQWAWRRRARAQAPVDTSPVFVVIDGGRRNEG